MKITDAEQAGAEGPVRRGVKSESAFRTIGEVAKEIGVPQHVLRYWEGRFPQLKPLQRAGNRRYYRPEDVTLVKRIHRLLDQEGYTMRGVQQMLARAEPTSHAVVPPPLTADAGSAKEALRSVRDALRQALLDDVPRG